MRIAIAHSNDDTTRLFKHLITDLGYTVYWSSNTAIDTIKQCKLDCPDLLLVQLKLSDMNGSELIAKIMKQSPTTIIAISDSVTQNPASVFEAMSAGALDAFSESSINQPKSIDEFKSKIKNIKKLHDSLQKNSQQIKTKSINNTKNNTSLVAIGASTGGPAALLKILSQFPAKPNTIIIIIQHMDNQFSQGMVQWLNDQIDISIEIAKNNQIPEIGHVYMAGTNDHLLINKSGRFQYTDAPVDYPYRPSVDVFFESALNNWPNKLIGVLLTGMGRDGANGLLSFYKRGMLTIAQSRQSCAVYGMPRAACELNAVSVELDINDIAKKIIKNI